MTQHTNDLEWLRRTQTDSHHPVTTRRQFLALSAAAAAAPALPALSAAASPWRLVWRAHLTRDLPNGSPDTSFGSADKRCIVPNLKGSRLETAKMFQSEIENWSAMVQAVGVPKQ